MKINKFDHENVVKTFKDANNLTKSATSTLAKPFIQAIPKMVLSAGDMHGAIKDGIKSSQSSILGSFNQVFKDCKAYGEYVHETQSKEKPEDFYRSPAVNDLRPKPATGFPKEDPLFFAELPKIKI